MSTSWVHYHYFYYGPWILVWAEQKSMSGKVDYNKYGVYFSMFAEGWVTDADGYTTSDTIEIALERVFYKPRCRSTVGEYTTTASGTGYCKYQSYQGSRALSKYLIRAHLTADSHSTLGTEIRAAY